MSALEVVTRSMRAGRLIAVAIAGILGGCSGGGGGGGGNSYAPPPTLHTVKISWTANRETAVNTTGGGYIVNISGQAPITVPYVAPGPLAPTTTTTQLWTGSYTVTVVAYSALNGPGSTTGSTSAPSAPITVVVP